MLLYQDILVPGSTHTHARIDPVQGATVSSSQFYLTNDHSFKDFFFAVRLYSETQNSKGTSLNDETKILP
jgi:hypothetical protein